MKWCVDFPEESILVVRPCLKRMCLDNKPAAKLLSVLLYRYSIRKEAKEDAENINEVKTANGQNPDQDTSFRIYRKQSQIVTDMVDEIDEKTLHDVAVPTLQLLGFLDIEEHPGMHCYIVHYDRVVAGLSAYKKGAKALEAFLKEIPQLEKVLISVQLEKVLINKRNFQLQLENIRIANRETSNCKRGRKPRQKAASADVSEEDRLLEISNEISNEECVSTDPPPAQSPASDTHTRVSSSSPSSEQVAEMTAPTQQARSRADSATSSAPDAPRTPTSPSVSPTGVRGVFPQDDNVVGSPPAENKSQVNKPVLSKQELALHQKWAKYISDEQNITKETVLKALALRQQWIEAYGQYGDADWDNAAFIWFAQNGGENAWENIQKVRSCMNGRKRNPDRVKSEWSQLEEQPTPSTPQKTLLPPRPKTREQLRAEAY